MPTKFFTTESIPAKISNQQVAVTTQVSYKKSFKFDFDKREFLMNGGNFIFAEERDNIEQWITKTLDTPKYIHAIYSDFYGNEAVSMLGQGLLFDVVDILLFDLIKEALLVDRRILGITKFNSEVDGDTVKVNFSIVLFDSTQITVVNSWVIR